MATRQIVPFEVTGTTNNVTQYCNPHQDQFSSVNIPARVCYAMRVRQIGVQVTTAPGSGKSWTFDVLKNGSTTGIQVVISDLATSGSSSGNVPYAEDDTITLQRTPANNPTTTSLVTYVTWAYDNILPNRNNYLSGSNVTSSNTSGNPLGWVNSSATTSVRTPSAVAGNLTKAKYNLATSPGSGGDAFRFTIYKNGVAQDGTSGTPDTRVTITDSATSGQWSGTLTVAAGDYLMWLAEPLNSPANTGRIAASFGFEPTTDGLSNVSTGKFGNLPNVSAVTVWTPATWTEGGSWDTVEANATIPILGSGLTFALTAIYVRTTFNVSNNLVFSPRRNSATPSPNLSATVTAGTQAGNDSGNSVSFASGDTISLQDAQAGAAGSATTAGAAFRMRAFAPAGGIGAGKGDRGNKAGGGVIILSPGGPIIICYNPNADAFSS